MQVDDPGPHRRGPAVKRGQDPRRVLLLAAAALFLPATATAQAVSGRVVSEADGTPIVGALIELRDADGERVAARLTGPAGAFSLAARAPGLHRLSVGAMGHATIETDLFHIAAGEAVTRTVRVPLAPIRLTGIRVTGARGCGGRTEDADLALVWEHARRGLVAIRVTQQATTRRYRIRRREADEQLRPRRIIDDTIWTVTTEGHNPVHAAPTDFLLDEGFVHMVEDTMIYYGPDADLVLSDDFADRYCFRLVRDGTDRIGLAFRPRDRPRRRGPVHIEGTLWMDAETAALRTLEFEYINPPLRQRGAWPGGQLTFEALPDGTWIVRSWWLRLPQPEIRHGRTTRTIVALRWSSGRVLHVTPSQ